MSYRKTFHTRNRIIGILLIAGALLLIGYAFYPTQYRADSFRIPAGPLPVEYALTVRYPSFGQVDAEAAVTAELAPAAPGDPAPESIVASEIQSVDIRFDPTGQVIAPLPAGRSVSFRWTAQGLQSGERSFSLFLFSLAAGTKPSDPAPTPFWAHTFAWKTFSGLGDGRPPVLVCATLMFLLGFGMLLASLLRRSTTR